MFFKKSKAAQVWFFPPYLLISSLVFSIGLEFGYKSYPIIIGGIFQSIIGIIITSCSVGLFIYSIFTFASNKEKVHPRSITTQIFKNGPFKLSRNPIYLAMVCLLLGFGITFNSMWFIYFSFANFVLLHYGIIIPEEIYLEKEFGKEYLEYKSTVRRWL
tara:strand:- start:214 stop:690 length:477 start_codon:yes stop_codon:yes gene_type:complete